MNNNTCITISLICNRLCTCFFMIKILNCSVYMRISHIFVIILIVTFCGADIVWFFDTKTPPPSKLKYHNQLSKFFMNMSLEAVLDLGYIFPLSILQAVVVMVIIYNIKSNSIYRQENVYCAHLKTVSLIQPARM